MPLRRPDEPTTHPIAQEVHDHARTVIDAELHRLARRVRTLRQADLDIIDAALEELAESLILERLRTAPPHSVPLLARLFSTKTKRTEGPPVPTDTPVNPPNTRTAS